MSVPARFRAHARRHVRLSVVVWHSHAGWQRDAEVSDLGFGGASLRLTESLAVGDHVTLSFVAPTLWDPLSIPGRVAWASSATRVEPGRAGVAFEPNEAGAMFALFELMGTLSYNG